MSAADELRETDAAGFRDRTGAVAPRSEVAVEFDADEEGDFRAGIAEDGEAWVSKDFWDALVWEFIHAVVSPRKKSPEDRCKDPACVHCVVPPRRPPAPDPWGGPWTEEEVRRFWRARYPSQEAANVALRDALKALRGEFYTAALEHRARWALSTARDLERAGRDWHARILRAHVHRMLKGVKTRPKGDED